MLMLASRRSCRCCWLFLDRCTNGERENAKDVAREDVEVVHNLRQRNPIDYPANQSLICWVAGVEANMSSRENKVERSSWFGFPFRRWTNTKEEGYLRPVMALDELPQAFFKKNSHQDLPQNAPRCRKSRVSVQRVMVMVKKCCVWWDFNSRRGMKGEKVQTMGRRMSASVNNPVIDEKANTRFPTRALNN